MNLKVIIRTYIREIRPRAQAELDCFRQEPSLESVIERAGLAINQQSKRYSHQRRLQKTTLEKAKRVLLTQVQAIKQSESFDDLFNLIDATFEPISGIGELYVYDTSLRIAAKLERLPRKVYLHRGTREGARALGLDSKSVALEVSVFPPEFRQLEPHEIEDVLCIFKDELKQVNVQTAESYMKKRSWCS